MDGLHRTYIEACRPAELPLLRQLWEVGVAFISLLSGAHTPHKDAPKVMTSVAQTTTKLSLNSVVANPANALRYTPLTWATELTVNYASKGYLLYSML